MSAEIPTVEPAELVVGDSWTWQKSLTDYPANAWMLTYYFRGQTGSFEVVCTESGANYLASVAKATTANYKAGRYQWTAIISSATERWPAGVGAIVLLPDPAQTGAGLDPRSHARKTLEALEAQIEGRATKQQQEYTIGTRSVKYLTPDDLRKWREYYRAEVAAEEAQENLAGGKPGGVRLLARL